MRNLDYSQYSLVKEALHERHTMFMQAPHLTNSIPILTPIYDWLQLPLQYLELKLYDIIAYPHIHNSYLIMADEATGRFPVLEKEGLKGAIVYYDGQFDDARFNLAVVLTATAHGASVSNYLKATNLMHNSDGKANGVRVQDAETGREFNIRGKVVVNAAGHFADHVRMMDSDDSTPVLQASRGTHIALDASLIPFDTGLLIPRTEDGRVLFLLPWHGATIAGTTDKPCEVTNNPRPSEEEIEYILRHVNRYFGLEKNLTRADVLSAWSGIRPLKRANDSKDTASVSREHAVYTSQSGMMTVVGGKWTTYRRMAVDVVNKIEDFHVALAPSNPPPATAVENDDADDDDDEKDDLRWFHTFEMKLHGAHNWNPQHGAALADEYEIPTDVARYLNLAYGDLAHLVGIIAQAPIPTTAPVGDDEESQDKPVAITSLKDRLADGYPYIAAEVIYAVEKEYARTPIDFLERRMRLSLVNNDAAVSALDTVVELFGRKLGWDSEKKAAETEKARTFFTISV
eukprot:TRINITY_DN1261_c0_g1_i2.p1 TRINITY_DN1261_c0_g1~~TRINITY_DN1261_c0_g1_i2.p1  ORF type:complete len:515 (+),score=149.04 TRINITY_DN1261_c0_g1_i2:205-1749(+)